MYVSVLLLCWYLNVDACLCILVVICYLYFIWIFSKTVLSLCLFYYMCCFSVICDDTYQIRLHNYVCLVGLIKE